MTRHEHMIRPASPSAIIHAAILASGDSLAYVAACAEMTVTELRAIIDGGRVRRRDVVRLAVALNRWHVALWGELEDARRACERWDDEEAEMAKEKR